MQHANLLPPQLTIGEAPGFDPQYTSAKSLASVRDTLANLVSQSCRVHVHVKEPKALARIAEPAAVELVNSSEVEADQGAEMVTKRTMTINWFLPDTRFAAQPQQPQGRD